MNLDLLTSPLDVSENPGLETIDPRFTDIATLVQNGDYAEATAQCHDILSEQIYDIRIICYYLYGYFIDSGLEVMAEIAQCLAILIREDIDAVGPVKNREKHVQTSLNWLLKFLLNKLQYDEKKKSTNWNTWISELSSDDVEEMLEAAEELRRSIGPVLEDKAGPVLQGLGKFTDWLSSFQIVVYREPEEEPEEETEEDDFESEDEIEEENFQEEKKSTLSCADDAATSIEGSYPLKLLLRKIQAFDELIKTEKFQSAALIAADINNVIANFDPKIYFPKLFAGFSLHYASHINELSSYEQYHESVEWQALQELYKVDIKSFVNLDTDAISLGNPGSTASHNDVDETNYDNNEEPMEEEEDDAWE